jgi:GT2 family glycosyltransferase
MFENVSIIIPAHKEEGNLDRLLLDLELIKDTAEIIVCQEGSRAHSMNVGAASSSRDFLWFLHADSRINEHNLKALGDALKAQPDCLHYFNLAFEGRGLFSLNSWGANIRSYIFGVPYGDQGLCISRKAFSRAGCYSEDLLYGEDLMLVWRLRQNGVSLNCVKSTLVSSPRKYKKHGWLKLTALYQWRWILMSIPEAWKLCRGYK